VLQTIGSRLEGDKKVSLLESALVDSAAKGFGYDGSLNLTLDQARNLGAAIGCDYYILGRGRLEPQSRGADQFVHRAWLALFLVDARSGRLANFEFLLYERSDPAEASTFLLTDLNSKLPLFLDRDRQRQGQPATGLTLPPNIIDLEDPEKSSQAVALQPPRILISPKPKYTKLAQTADVTATVDLKVTFLSDGTIGPIEIVRWAGFGLDESSIEAARMIRFRPATLRGQPVAVRALVQYKFHLKAGEPSIQ
jgi:protein TonB